MFVAPCWCRRSFCNWRPFCIFASIPAFAGYRCRRPYYCCRPYNTVLASPYCCSVPALVNIPALASIPAVAGVPFVLDFYHFCWAPCYYGISGDAHPPSVACMSNVASVPAVAGLPALTDLPFFYFPFCQDLVITQIITAEEFWSNHAAEYVKQKQAIAQEVGVSGKWTTFMCKYKVCPVRPFLSHHV